MLFFAFYGLEQTKRATYAELSRTVELQKRVIEGWFTEQAAGIRGISRLPSLRNLEEERVLSDFKVFKQTRPDFSSAGYVNKEGRMLFATEDLRGMYLGDREYFKQAIQGNDYISDIMVGRASGKAVVVFASPVYGYDGTIQGVAFGAVNLDRITALVENYWFGHTGETYLINSQGFIINETRFGNELRKEGGITGTTRMRLKIDTALVQKAFAEGQGNAAYLDYRGQKVLGAFYLIPQLRWAVAAEMNQDEVYAPFYRQLRIMAAVVAGLLTIILPLVLLYVKRITQPIRILTNTSREIVKGNYEYAINEQVFSQAPNELKLLWDAFNQMSMTVKVNLDLLQSTNDTLGHAEAQFRSLVENSLVGVYIIRNNRFCYVNPRMSELFGYSSQELLHKPWVELIYPDDQAMVAEDIRQRIAGEVPNASYELRALHKDGTVLDLAIYSSLCIFEGESTVMGVALDITERKRAEEELKYISLHDKLTDLYNRVYFEEEMRRLSGGRFSPVGIITVDVDGLKIINDTMGHQVGDRLITTVAGILRESVRSSDVVARIGGDEFAILLPKTDTHTIRNVLARVAENQEKYRAEQPYLPIYMSVGYAQSGDYQWNIEDVFREADDRMYREKFRKRQEVRSAIVQTLFTSTLKRDEELERHMRNVEELAVMLGASIGMPEEQLSRVRIAARIHDIGRVGVTNEIWLKPSALRAEEYSEAKRHSEIGYRIAQISPDTFPVADLVLKHHERWDGTGYPLGLKGIDIPLECRVLAIADAYDAMAQDRPYRKALPFAERIQELQRWSGKQFDPQLVSGFIELLRQKHEAM
jgi:diguanylate cyclase (GGDEF)-like protein/PAS domain S-box-containing protein